MNENLESNAVQIRHSSAVALHLLAVAHFDAGQYDRALVYVRFLLGRTPDHVGLLRLLAAIEQERGNLDAALQAADHAAGVPARIQDRQAIQLLRARILHAMNRTYEAEQAAEASLVLRNMRKQ